VRSKSGVQGATHREAVPSLVAAHGSRHRDGLLDGEESSVLSFSDFFSPPHRGDKLYKNSHQEGPVYLRLTDFGSAMELLHIYYKTHEAAAPGR
jgi:hypothetical protein